MKATYTLFENVLGICAVAWGDEGFLALQLPEKSVALTEKTMKQRLRSRGFQAAAEDLQAAPSFVRKALKVLTEQLSGQNSDLASLPIDLSRVSPFHRKVYEALRRTRPGQTLTYSELAAKAGSPKAFRAVGQAMAKNPLPLMVPCHRVLGAGGSLTGFSAPGGTGTKFRILQLESAS
ncbi:MAG: methylated-DNA--[protein]-cysteine S-methyltransferase [Bdellovibrionales bacterium]|nr:methylated-DNA--[protein]-cysteine S-methyltransferase [Bdellovibrionales bacterium]